jgi:hypothetical protein
VVDGFVEGVVGAVVVVVGDGVVAPVVPEPCVVVVVGAAVVVGA